MNPRQGRFLVPLGLRGEGLHDCDKPPAHQVHCFAHYQQIGIVDHVHAGRAEMQNFAGDRRLICICMQVGHHVMPHAALVYRRSGEVHIIDMLSQCGDLFRGDGQPHFVLRLGEGQPDASPGRRTAARGEQFGHGPRRVARHQRTGVHVAVTNSGLRQLAFGHGCLRGNVEAVRERTTCSPLRTSRSRS